MKYSKNEIEDFKKLKQCYSQMSWYILECDIMYYSVSDFPNSIKIDNSWINLRSISDELYEQRKQTLKHLADAINEKAPDNISIDVTRPSVKIAIEKMEVPVKNPVCWPTDIEQMQIYILMLNKFSNKYLKNIKKQYEKDQGLKNVS